VLIRFEQRIFGFVKAISTNARHHAAVTPGADAFDFFAKPNAVHEPAAGQPHVA
jgi:hypothetical protein